jgi:hypothetical protein
VGAERFVFGWLLFSIKTRNLSIRAILSVFIFLVPARRLGALAGEACDNGGDALRDCKAMLACKVK